MDRYLTTSEARQKFLHLVDEVEDGESVPLGRAAFLPSAIHAQW
jgi:hypothetical protein